MKLYFFKVIVSTIVIANIANAAEFCKGDLRELKGISFDMGSQKMMLISTGKLDGAAIAAGDQTTLSIQNIQQLKAHFPEGKGFSTMVNGDTFNLQFIKFSPTKTRVMFSQTNHELDIIKKIADQQGITLSCNH